MANWNDGATWNDSVRWPKGVSLSALAKNAEIDEMKHAVYLQMTGFDGDVVDGERQQMLERLLLELEGMRENSNDA